MNLKSQMEFVYNLYSSAWIMFFKSYSFSSRLKQDPCDSAVIWNWRWLNEFSKGHIWSKNNERPFVRVCSGLPPLFHFPSCFFFRHHIWNEKSIFRDKNKNPNEANRLTNWAPLVTVSLAYHIYSDFPAGKQVNKTLQTLSAILTYKTKAIITNCRCHFAWRLHPLLNRVRRGFFSLSFYMQLFIFSLKISRKSGNTMKSISCLF